jgi:hypothetical protein
VAILRCDSEGICDCDNAAHGRNRNIILKNDAIRRLLRTDIQPSIGLSVHHSPFAQKACFAAHSLRPLQTPINALAQEVRGRITIVLLRKGNYPGFIAD